MSLHICSQCQDEAIPERCLHFEFDWDAEADPIATTECAITSTPKQRDQETNNE